MRTLEGVCQYAGHPLRVGSVPAGLARHIAFQSRQRMLDLFYKKRLKEDLEGWVDQGWVSSEAAAHILEATETSDGGRRLPMVLGGIGVVCIALALAAFIAANWGGIPKNLKLAGIAIMILAAHGLAAWAAQSGRKGVADLATAFATLVFVGGMALVGQIFHLPEDWPGGAFLVCLGGLAAAWMTGSKASLIVAAAAAITWQVGRADFGEALPGESLIGLALLAVILLHPVAYPARLSRWAAISLLLVTYGRWLADTGERLSGGDDLGFAMVLLGGAGLAATMIQLGQVADLAVKWSSYYPQRSHGKWLMLRALQDVGFALLSGVLVFLLIALSEFEDAPVRAALATAPVAAVAFPAVLMCVIGLLLSYKTGKSMSFFAAILAALVAVAVSLMVPNVLLTAALVLAALIGLSMVGTLYNIVFWSLCAYAGLTAVLLWLLQVTIGSLLGQSLFFLVAGLLLLVMAWFATRLLRRRKPPETPGEQEGGT